MRDRPQTPHSGVRRWLRATGPVFGLLAVSVGIRLWGIEVESLWSDEAFSARVSTSVRAAVGNACDGTPALYHIGLSLWRWFLPATEAGLRSYSVIWSVVGLLLLYLLSRDTCGHKAGLAALLLGAVNPLDIYYAQEVRMYAQAEALALLSAWCLWRWLVDERRRPRYSFLWLLGHAVTAAALLLTHYVGAAVLLAQGLFALVLLLRRSAWRRALHYCLAAVLAALLFSPWLAFVVTRCGSLYQSRLVSWIPEVPVLHLFDFLAKEIFWGPGEPVVDKAWLVSAPVALAVMVFAIAERRTRGFSTSVLRAGGPASAYLLWLLFGPVLIVAILSSVYHPVYYPMRFSLFVLPAFLALAGRMTTRSGARAVRLGVLAMAFAVMVCGSAVQGLTLQKADWRVFAEVWRARGEPEPVIVLPGFASVAARHYADTRMIGWSSEWLMSISQFLQGREVWVAMPRWVDEPVPGMYDGEIASWLEDLGAPEHLEPPSGVKLLVYRGPAASASALLNERFDEWYSPLSFPGRIRGFADTTQFGGIVTSEDSLPTRLVAGRAQLALERAPQGGRIILGLQTLEEVAVDRLRVYTARSESLGGQSVLTTSPAVVLDEVPGGQFEVALDLPEGSGPVSVGWNATSTAAATVAESPYVLGLRWVAVERMGA